MTPPHQGEPGPSPGDRLAVLGAVLAADPSSCTNGEIGDAIIGLLHERDGIDAALAGFLQEFDSRMVFAVDGSRTPGVWLGERAEVTRAQGNALVHQSRDLRACPHVASGFASGRIGTAKVRLLLGARPVHPSLFAEHEAGLVHEIEPLTVDQAAKAIKHWIAMAEATRAFDAAGDDAAEDDPAQENTFHLSQTLNGRFTGALDLDPLAGSELDQAISGRIDEMFAQGTYTADDGMTSSQRKAAALVELALRGANPTQTSHGDLRPSVSVEIDHKSLLGLPAESLADGLARRCHLEGGTPITRSAAERCLCNARVHAIATALRENGTVEVVGVTDHLRNATRKQRRALKRRDGGCAYPGCGAPPTWCEAHHINPVELGGPTLLSNMVLLCRHHHHLVHEGRHRLWRTPDDGLVHVLRADGTPIPVTRPGEKVLDETRGGRLQPPQPWPPPPHANAPAPDRGHGPPPPVPPTRFTTLTHSR